MAIRCRSPLDELTALPFLTIQRPDESPRSSFFSPTRSGPPSRLLSRPDTGTLTRKWGAPASTPGLPRLTFPSIHRRDADLRAILLSITSFLSGFRLRHRTRRSCRSLSILHSTRFASDVFSAQAYGNEAEVGDGIIDSGVPREEIFLTTKIDNMEHKDVAKVVDESLKKLKTDYVDLILMHWPVSIGESPVSASSALRHND